MGIIEEITGQRRRCIDVGANVGLCMANCNSGGNRKLEQTAAILFPSVAV
jgi:hypothetical protein